VPRNLSPREDVPAAMALAFAQTIPHAEEVVSHSAWRLAVLQGIVSGETKAVDGFTPPISVHRAPTS
jgi:hypothetical protein